MSLCKIIEDGLSVLGALVEFVQPRAKVQILVGRNPTPLPVKIRFGLAVADLQALRCAPELRRAGLPQLHRLHGGAHDLARLGADLLSVHRQPPLLFPGRR